METFGLVLGFVLVVLVVAYAVKSMQDKTPVDPTKPVDQNRPGDDDAGRNPW